MAAVDGIRADQDKESVSQVAVAGPGFLSVDHVSFGGRRRTRAQRRKVAASAGLRESLCPQLPAVDKCRNELAGKLGSEFQSGRGENLGRKVGLGDEKPGGAEFVVVDRAVHR